VEEESSRLKADSRETAASRVENNVPDTHDSMDKGNVQPSTEDHEDEEIDADDDLWESDAQMAKLFRRIMFGVESETRHSQISPDQSYLQEPQEYVSSKKAQLAPATSSHLSASPLGQDNSASLAPMSITHLFDSSSGETALHFNNCQFNAVGPEMITIYNYRVNVINGPPPLTTPSQLMAPGVISKAVASAQ
jgi:hypothetical protein